MVSGNTFPCATLRFTTTILIDTLAENYGNCNPTNWSTSSWEVYALLIFPFLFSITQKTVLECLSFFFLKKHKMRHFLEGHVDNYCQDAKTACNYYKMPPAGKITSAQTFQVEIRSCNSHF